VKLKAAYEKFSSGVTRDLRARTAQAALVYLGYRPGDPDGLVGQNTRNAVAAFRRDEKLPAGDALDDATYAALMKKAKLA
jgi:localization factor PodJL